MSEFENYYGLNPVTLIDCLEKMGEELNNKLNIHLNKVRQFFKEKNYKKIFEAYHSAFPDTVKGSEEEQES